MENLLAPSPELASRILNEVSFEDRLTASILHVRAGVRTLSLYSLEEVFSLLKEPYPQIDLDRLEEWLRIVIRDSELADKINEVIVKKSAKRDALPLIRDLVGLRLIQCKQLT